MSFNSKLVHLGSEMVSLKAHRRTERITYSVLRESDDNLYAGRLPNAREMHLKQLKFCVAGPCTLGIAAMIEGPTWGFLQCRHIHGAPIWLLLLHSSIPLARLRNGAFL